MDEVAQHHTLGAVAHSVHAIDITHHLSNKRAENTKHEIPLISELGTRHHRVGHVDTFHTPKPLLHKASVIYLQHPDLATLHFSFPTGLTAFCQGSDRHLGWPEYACLFHLIVMSISCWTHTLIEPTIASYSNTKFTN